MALALSPTLLFFDPAKEKDGALITKKHAAKNPDFEKRLFCAACRHPITRQDERMPVQGSHQHTFTNPHGITYHVGCYREAAGCAVTGEATAAFSWFAGYAWRVALCGNCHTHLGWRFQSGADYFHCLIVNRLTSIGPAGK